MYVLTTHYKVRLILHHIQSKYVRTCTLNEYHNVGPRDVVAWSWPLTSWETDVQGNIIGLRVHLYGLCVHQPHVLLYIRYLRETGSKWDRKRK